MGFIIGFRDDRNTVGVDVYYITFMLISVIFVAISLLLKLMMQRMWMYKFGQNPEYKYSINSLLIGVVLVFASEGFLWFLAPGFMMPHHLQTERLGKWRYGLKYVEHSRALAFGIMGTLVFAMILKFFQGPDSVYITHLININLAIAIYSMLPFPENDGIFILYGRRWMFVFTLFLALFTLVFIKLLTSPFVIFFTVLFLASVVVLWYNLKGQPVWFK